MTVAQMLAAARTLSYRERVELIKQLVDSLDDKAVDTPKHSLRELRGLGKEIWEGIDAQDYIHEQRDEWDK